MQLLNNFLRDRSGNVAVTFSLALLPLMGLAGAALDYSRANRERDALQVVTDAAAIKAASAPSLSDEQRVSLAKSFVPQGTDKTAYVTGKSVTVVATTHVRTGILAALGILDIPIGATATATRLNQGPPICVMALHPIANGAVTFAGSASFVAQGCAVHSNSTSGNALVVNGSASVRAESFCAVGGVSAPSTVSPRPESNCDRLDDPFRTLPQAVSSGCDQNNVQVQPGTTVTLSPGIYCNGLDIEGTATLQSGLYVIKNGPLTISSQANVSGPGVTFYLSGHQAGFTFNGGGAVTLSAMTTGPYQGMLIVQDRQSNTGASNTLNGDANTSLSGAIYLPTQSLTVNGSSTFGQASSFMPIIAEQVKFAGSTTARTDVSSMRTPAPLPLSQGGARLVN